jgi:type VI secretion system secreted protein Hcp
MKRTSGVIISIALSTLMNLGSPAYAAVDMFLKIDGIQGESQDKEHKDEIDVLAWSWQLSHDISAGGGAGTSSPVIRPITIQKWIDSASPALYNLLLTGAQAATATLTVRKAGEPPLEYIIIDLEKVVVTSISTGGSGGEDRLTEQISLGFESINFTYVPQNQDGTGGTPGEFGWDIKANE